MVYVELIVGSLLLCLFLSITAAVLLTRRPIGAAQLALRTSMISVLFSPLMIGADGHPPLIAFAPAISTPLLTSRLVMNGAIEWIFRAQNAPSWKLLIGPFLGLWLITFGVSFWSSRRATARRAAATSKPLAGSGR